MPLTDVEKVAKRAGISEKEARSILYGGERGRTWNAPLKVRAISTERQARAADGDADPADKEADSDELIIEGYSAVFDEPTMLYSWMQETIKRGAFKRVLKENPDVRLLENHVGRAYARTSTGTLTVEEKPRGLFMRAELDSERQDAKDLYRTIDRGDCNQQSFAFTIKRSTLTTCECDTWMCDCIWERDIEEIGELFEVSAVTFPAYPTTDVGVARTASEQPVERVVQASDQEQHETTATEPDASRARSEGDQAVAIRLRVIALGGITNATEVPGTGRAAQSC